MIGTLLVQLCRCCPDCMSTTMSQLHLRSLHTLSSFMNLFRSLSTSSLSTIFHQSADASSEVAFGSHG